MLKDLANGLRVVHGANPSGTHYMHRDIKPNNIMVDKVARRLCLVDFGSTKKIAEKEMSCHSADAGCIKYEVKLNITLTVAEV